MKPTILVVDDERNIRRSLDMILVGEGYEVLCGESGAHALSLAEAHRPDAMLLDIVLPDLDGIEVLKRIRTQSTGGIMGYNTFAYTSRVRPKGAIFRALLSS